MAKIFRDKCNKYGQREMMFALTSILHHRETYRYKTELRGTEIRCFNSINYLSFQKTKSIESSYVCIFEVCFMSASVYFIQKWCFIIFYFITFWCCNLWFLLNSQTLPNCLYIFLDRLNQWRALISVFFISVLYPFLSILFKNDVLFCILIFWCRNSHFFSNSRTLPTYIYLF